MYDCLEYYSKCILTVCIKNMDDSKSAGWIYSAHNKSERNLNMNKLETSVLSDLLGILITTIKSHTIDQLYISLD